MILTLSLSLGVISEAEAKRFGGASSFGSKPAYSKSYKRKTTPVQKSASQQQAYNQNQAARQSMSKRGGLMGLLGGLALGGLLGSLLFGGAFENFNFMDILVFGSIAFLLLKLFAAKTTYSKSSPAYSRDTYASTDQTKSSGNADFDTDIFSTKARTSGINTNGSLSEKQRTEDAIVLPKAFNEQDFLNGAKSAFKRLQAAWDQRDLAEVRSLCTDKVFAEIQSQLQKTDSINHTDVLRIDAELLEVREVGNELEAVVLFDTIMRENLNAQPEQVREVWTFIKPKNSLQTKWYLDGLQQLEV